MLTNDLEHPTARMKGTKKKRGKSGNLQVALSQNLPYLDVPGS